MNRNRSRLHIGMRTIKTAAAVILSMIVVDSYGATTSKLIFAMLGAMAAVQPTFKESLESCLTQIIGVLFGALAGVFLLALPVDHLVSTGIGIIMVITLYNSLRIRFSPSLPCFIVVMLCTTPDIEPISYAIGRIWDSAIGLGIGMLINTLVFPYDNSSQIRATAERIDKEVIVFLSDMFDGDDELPNLKKMTQTIDDMSRQLRIFSNQMLILRLKRQMLEIEAYQLCQEKAREMIAQMEVLSRMGKPGRVSQENIDRLVSCGAVIRQSGHQVPVTERDIVTNYHVEQILSLRQELLTYLSI